jgi:hypothetical protein
MRSFGVNSTKEGREHSSMWWKNLINTNMRESVGQITTPQAYFNYQTDKMIVTLKEAVRDRTKTLAEIKNTRHVQ